MHSNTPWPILLFLLLVVSWPTHGQSPSEPPTLEASTGDAAAELELTPGQQVGSQLPPRVRGLLIREMVALQEAMNRVLDALIRGHDATVAEQAESIRDSFILKQEMTPDDRKGLLAAVPEAFVTRDRAFHALGGRLAEAAHRGDRDEQLRLYGELVTACAQCHALHARDRFPDFSD